MDNSIVHLVLGASITCTVFTSAQASHQTWVIYKRDRKFTLYVAVVWAELITSFSLSVITWIFLKGIVMPDFGLFFSMLCLWTVQMHCILQILLNRTSLIVHHKRRTRQLQIITFVLVTLLNISVFCIWIPAQMRVSDTYVRLNHVWLRVENSIWAIIDSSLNSYFLWAVRTRLTGNGLTKYRALFRLNVFMVVISISLNLVLIGSLFLPGLTYFQFHALAYLIKLHIELNLVEMTFRIMQTAEPLDTFDLTTSPTC